MSSVLESLRGLAKSTAIIFAGTVLGNIFALLSQIAIARSLDPETFGHISLAYTVISTAGIITLLGIPDGVTRIFSVEEDPIERRSIIQSGYILVLITGTLMAVVVYSLRGLLAVIMSESSLEPLLTLFLPYLLLLPIARVSLGVIRANGRSRAATLARDLLPRSLSLSVFALFLLAGNAFIGAVIYWLLVPAIFCVTSLYFVNDNIRIKKLASGFPQFKTVRRLWSFSWPLAISSALFIVLSNADILMIGYFLNSESVGYYRAIQPLRRIPTFIFTSVAFLLLPLVSRYYENKDYKEIDYMYTTSTKWMVLLTFPLVISVALFAQDVVLILFGEQYGPAAPALSVLLLGLFFRTIFGLNGDILKAIGATKTELYSALVGVIVNILLNILFIPRYGIVGAAAATTLGYFVYNVVEVIFIYRLIGIHPFTVTAYKPLIPTAVFGLLVSVFLGANRIGVFKLAAIGILITIVEVVAVVTTQSLNEDDVELLEAFGHEIGINLSQVRSYIE